MKKYLLLALAVPVILGAGCNQAQTSQNAGQTGQNQAEKQQPKKELNACKLLTPEIAKAALGTETKDPDLSNVGEVVSTCTYGSTDASLKVITLLARRAYEVESSKEVFDSAKAQSKALSGKDPVAISGLGDDAYWAGGTLNQLNVRKGDTWLILTAKGIAKESDPESLRKPMEDILKNY